MKLKLFTLFIGILMAGTALAKEDKVIVRLGTVAPEGTPWERALKKTRKRFKKMSAGKIKMKTFFGGQKGDEQDIVITTIGEIFVYELVKYISKIRFAVEGQDQTEVDFKTLPPKQMVELFETLPMSISQLLINKVNEFKEFESNFTTAMSSDGEVDIPIDVTLFASE